jgi:hypothetical protein
MTANFCTVRFLSQSIDSSMKLKQCNTTTDELFLV